MDFLESMSIEQLVLLNQDIQKVLKEKRKARQQTYKEVKYGKNVKIGVECDTDGTPKEYFLKVRQRYVQDCFITALAGDPEKFNKDISEFCSSVQSAYETYMEIPFEED